MPQGTSIVARPNRTRLGHRLLFSVIGLLAGEVTMAALVGGQPLWLYFMLTVAIGWACVGLPVILPLPSRVVSQASWPVVLIAGGCLGLLALAVVFITTAALQWFLGPSAAPFSLSGLLVGTGLLWPMASLVSMVSVAVYSALIRHKWR